MLRLNTKKIVIGILIGGGATLSFLSPSALAFGGDHSGGGDKCQERIEDIRNDVSNWIKDGGSAGLEFKEVPNLTLAIYNSEMQDKILFSRTPNAISCTDDKTKVMIEGKEKMCRADTLAPGKVSILCYRGVLKDGKYTGGFMDLSEDDQYFQVHHEFAVLSGFEDQKAAVTNYPLSKQISAYLKNTNVKKLGILPAKNTPFIRLEPGDYKSSAIYTCGRNVSILEDGKKYILEITSRNGSDENGNIVNECSVAGQTFFVELDNNSNRFTFRVAYELSPGIIWFRREFWTPQPNGSILVDFDVVDDNGVVRSKVVEKSIMFKMKSQTNLN
jgi:hypothetical protein